MFFYTLKIFPHADVEDLWGLLKAEGIEPLYSTEDDQQIELHVQSKDPWEENLKKKFSGAVIEVEDFQLPDINWESQWENHAFNYQDGFLHMQVQEQEIRLLPGPGFGDLSHPTTRLMVQELENQDIPSYVIDIGCGSGILTCAAAALGAQKVDGIDIDAAALVHTLENAKLNHMQEKIQVFLPGDFNPIEAAGLIVINMIQSEQQIAWDALSCLKDFRGRMIASGILKEQQGEYMAWVQTLGWRLEQVIELEGWIALNLSR